MDKSWMTEPRSSNQYLNGVDSFLDFAFSRVGTPSGKIVCPCVRCVNRLWHTRDVVREHLVCKGMISGYSLWHFHGEDIRTRNAPPIDPDPPCDSSLEEHCNMDDLVRDAFGIHDIPNAMNEDVDGEESSEDDSDPNVDQPHIHTEDGPNAENSGFLKFFQEGNQELYPGSKSTVLSFTVQLMHMKSYYKWSGCSVKMLLKFLKQQFPQSNIPQTLYEAKKMTSVLGLGYENIDACANNCMLYRGNRAAQESCHVCNSSRWKQDDEVSGRRHKKNKIACKTMKYFPLIPRLQRLYMSSKTSSSMRWHNEGRTKDGLLRHPADSLAWKTFDQNYPEFAR